jgi:TorA maturation chaperone TorD
MEDHLGKWVPQFCDKIINEADMSFYSEMAKITAKFVDIEAEDISGYITEAQNNI